MKFITQPATNAIRQRAYQNGEGRAERPPPRRNSALPLACLHCTSRVLHAASLIFGRPVDAAPVTSVRTEQAECAGNQGKQGGKTAGGFAVPRYSATLRPFPALSSPGLWGLR